jgi:murein DD-endopeptidase MepM/ murein hydrolase activator NlpD
MRKVRRGAAVSRRDETTFVTLTNDWRRSAASALSSTDGRWALVSTSVTALIAGSVAWLAMGTALPTTPHGNQASRSLIPYELFQRLSAGSHTQPLVYASLSPLGSIAPRPAPQITAPAAPLDDALTAEDTFGDEDSAASSDAHTVTLEPGQSLAAALTSAGATRADANGAILAMAKVFNPRELRAGTSLAVTFAPPEKSDSVPIAQITYVPPSDSAARDDALDDAAGPAAPQIGRLLSVSFSPTIQQDITISLGANGKFAAQSSVKQLAEHFHRAGARIDSSLYLAAMQAGIPAPVVVQMIHMFSYEVDFQRDLRPGNSFEVFYSFYYTPDGKPAKNGEVSYASIHLGDRTVTLYRYQPKGETTADYFNAKGQSAKSMLMKTPVDGARISSGFGMRFHPVLGYTRMHKGIDFAVPTGTPVMAAGSGTIKKEGWEGGYGNFMVVDHGNTYATAYGHLSRFAPGVHLGSHVHQGQVIAYSGATGLATGPHLHYEIRINGTQVNPATVKVARGRILAGHDLVSFQEQRLHVDNELTGMPLETKLADTATDLRATKD